MLALGIISILITLAICVGLVYYYWRKKTKVKSKVQKTKLVSRKEFRSEVEKLEEYKHQSEIDVIDMINKFIDDNKKRFDSETDHEKKKDLLIAIRKDIQLITNSFAWERIVDVEEMIKKYEPYIDMLRKQRPSKWTKIEKEQ